LAKPASAGIVISVDWDATQADVQSTIAANPGDTVTANIIFRITGASSISNYEMSTRFSSSALLFVSRIDTGPTNLPNIAIVGFNEQDTGFTTPGLGAYGINYGIAGVNLFGPGPTSVDGQFSVSAITFIVGPGADGLVLMPGIFPNNPDMPVNNPDRISRFDGFDNNSNMPILATEFIFNGGIITAVPEPSAVALVSFALVAAGVRTYRNRRNLVA